MYIYIKKTSVLHVRRKSSIKRNFQLKLCQKSVELCSEYKYLGVMINKHLDYQLIADARFDEVQAEHWEQ